MEIQQTYRMLKYQEALYKKELDIKKKELQEISMEKQNITIKKIHGELYYYAQQRKDGKVKSSSETVLGELNTYLTTIWYVPTTVINANMKTQTVSSTLFIIFFKLLITVDPL